MNQYRQVLRIAWLMHSECQEILMSHSHSGFQRCFRRDMRLLSCQSCGKRSLVTREGG